MDTDIPDGALADLQHRIKNMAALIRAISRRTAETSTDLEDYQTRFDGRLGALVRAQSAMVRTTAGAVDLEEMVRDTLLEAAPGTEGRWSADGPRTALAPGAIETLALIVHELAWEASLDGALAGDEGEVRIRWGTDGERLSFTWREQAAARRDIPESLGLARELVEQAIPYQFRGEGRLEVDDNGLDCRIAVPWPGSRR